MNMPIPEVLDSQLPADPEARQHLILFQDVGRGYESALKTSLCFEQARPFEFPQLIASWLFSMLQRVRLTSWGVITAINASNEC